MAVTTEEERIKEKFCLCYCNVTAMLSVSVNMRYYFPSVFLFMGIKYGVITNDVSDYINLLVKIAHIICNHSLYLRVIIY
jgi:hypothetical protein